MKNKRLVAGLLALTFVFGGAVLPEKNADNIAVVSASAAENGDSDTYIGGAISCGDYFIGVKEDGTCDIVSYIGTDSILEIPAEIDGHIVTGIARSAFEDTITFTEVKIPEGVTYIGEGAFYGLSDLKKVELPSTVEIIERAAFSRCDSLESVKLSEGLLTIEEFAFSECTSLQNIEFPKSLKTIGTHAFSFNGLVTVSLPDGLTTLGRDVFLGCEDLIAAYIPGSLETIPMCAFMGCASLNDLVICDGVKNIGEQAFSYCDALEQVMLPDSVTDVLLGNFNNSTIYCNSGSYAESFAIDNGLDLYIYDADMSIKPEITYEMGDGCVKLTWDAVEGADKYAVAGYVDGKWKSLATGDGTSYVLKGLKYNTSYRVAVFPRINGVWNRNSTNNIFVRTYYTTPKIRGLGYNKEHNRFSVEWRPVDTAEQYAVCMYKDGYVYFRQRLKRMIVSGGYNIYPQNIEEVINSHRDVVMCAAVGVPDKIMGELVRAYVVAKEGVNREVLRTELMDMLKKEIAVYALPRELRFRDSLPKTLVGKIDYLALKAEE